MAMIISNTVVGVRVKSVRVKADKNLGIHIEFVLEANTGEALQFWEKIVATMGMPVFVNWEGEVDISPEELGQRMKKLLEGLKNGKSST
jgi:hypothetical protein